MTTIASHQREPTNCEPEILVDVTRTVCPMTYVRVRLALDAAAPGAILRVLLRGPDARRNVPATAAEHGHAILSLHDEADGITVLRLRKHPLPERLTSPFPPGRRQG